MVYIVPDSGTRMPVLNLALLLAVTLGKCHNLSDLQFNQQKVVIIIVFYPLELL